MNRIFHIAGLTWVIVSLTVLGFGWPAAPFLAAGTAVLMLLLMFGRKRLPLWIFSAAAAVCFCAFSLLCHQWMDQRAHYTGTTQSVRGVVTDQIFLEHSAETHLRLSADNPPGLENARILLRSRLGVEETIGDVVEYSVRLDAANRAALRAQGFDFQAFTQSSRLLGRDERAAALPRLRQVMSGRFARLLPKGEGALLSGVLLGRGERIPQSVREDYAKAGISHLLAVSGLHLTVMLSLFSLLLQFSWFSRRERLLIEIALAFAFAALAGFSPSILRAAAMFALCRAALLLGRDSDGLNSLGFSIILFLLINPYAVFNISLQLSYLATMGINAFAEPMACWFSKALFATDFFSLSEDRPKPATVLSIVCVTLSAQILTAPLVCWQFGRFSLISPVTNLLTSLPVTFMLLLGMICAALGFVPFLEPLYRMTALGSGLLAKLVSLLAQGCASLPFASFPVQDDGIIFWLAASTLLLILLWYLRCTRRLIFWAMEWIACTLAAALCIHLVCWGHPITVSVSNYGDSVLILYGNQAALLGVPGRTGETDRLVSLMKDYKVTSLCLLIPEKSAQLETAAAKKLLRIYPPAETVSLDTCASLEGTLFGSVSISGAGNGIRLETGGFSLLKSFDMRPAAAHILINQRNEIVTIPELHLTKNSRYYGCTRIFLPEPKPFLEDTP